MATRTSRQIARGVASFGFDQSISFRVSRRGSRLISSLAGCDAPSAEGRYCRSSRGGQG